MRNSSSFLLLSRCDIEDDYDLIQHINGEQVELLETNFKYAYYQGYPLKLEFFADDAEIINVLKKYQLLNSI
jgi:predicted metal-dependent TIM-barrel fold hydrolase